MPESLLLPPTAAPVTERFRYVLIRELPQPCHRSCDLFSRPPFSKGLGDKLRFGSGPGYCFRQSLPGVQ